MTQNKSVLITGASGGIGAACARRFDAMGYRVGLVCNQNQEKADVLARSLKDAVVFCADFTDATQVNRLCIEAEEKLGVPDVIVNNAGIAHSALFQDTTEEDLEKILSVNLKAPMALVRHFASGMISRHSGSVVNVASIWGQTGASMEVLYSVSKAALIGFTKALAKEFAPSSIRVNCVCPGVIDTDMMKCYSGEDIRALEAEIPLGRLGTAEEVASCVTFLAEETAAYLTGQIISPNGGWLI